MIKRAALSLCVVLICLGTAACPAWGRWRIERVDSTGNVGWYTSLALDSAGYSHISYYDGAGSDLKYAHEDAGGWNTEVVDTTGFVGQYTSLALDGSGYPHISYYDEANLDLKYGHKDAGGWHIETVDSTDNVGQYTSLALDANGYTHISYYYATTRDLKYAYEDAGGWHIEKVDSTSNVGEFSSLALDNSGYAHISYYDAGANHDLKYAYRDTGGWNTEVVDTTEDVGQYTSLALDVNGYAHVSYYYATTRDLKYAYEDAGGWHVEKVDSTSNVGEFSSLALDNSGYPHISYYDAGANHDLKYAYRDAGGWHIETVDSVGLVGQHTSIALDNSGYPHISYYNADSLDLKYAVKELNDAGVDSILAPPDTVIAGYVYIPRARVMNFGQVFTDTFYVSCFIDSLGTVIHGDTTSSPIILGPGDTVTVNFDFWTVPPWDSVSYGLAVVTLLKNDENPANDTLSKSIFAYKVWHDVGVDSILAPPHIVFAESLYTPIARVENYGDFIETFDVRCRIDSVGGNVYLDTFTVTDLDPSAVYPCSFQTWTVPLADSAAYTMTVRTLLGGDERPWNDILSQFVFAYGHWRDVGVGSILSPPDTVFSDSEYVPVARVENFSQFFTDTFDVSCLIDSSGTVIHGDTMSGVILDPGDTVSVSFDQWQVPAWDSIWYGITFVTLLANDANAQNDTLSKQIHAVRSSGPDTEPPSISHSSVTQADSGNSIAIAATITDNVDVAAATLYYCRGGESSFVSCSMSNPSDSIWNGVIPGGSVEARGVEYYIWATDGVNEANHGSPHLPHQITVAATLSSSTSARVYRMISLPVDPADRKPDSVLVDDLGGYNREVWRLFRWDGSSYDEYPDIEDMTSGRGFWLITRDSEEIDASGETVWADDSIYYEIPLQPEWNQIGHPFSFAVSWEGCLADSGGIRRPIGDQSQLWIEDRLVEYSNGGYRDADEFQAWRGYWVKNMSGSSVSLLVPQRETGSATLVAGCRMQEAGCRMQEAGLPMTNDQIPITKAGVKDANPKSGIRNRDFGRGGDEVWIVQLSAFCGGAKDEENLLGISPDAREGWDRLDLSEPPVIGDYVSLYFPHEEWAANPGRYTRDMRALNQMQDARCRMPDTPEERGVWRFVVETNVGYDHVVLTWEAIEGRPRDAYLVDLSTGVIVKTDEADCYSYATSGALSSREFELRLGGFSPSLSGKLIIPRFFCYPNPAAGSFSSVRIECETEAMFGVKVFNAAGALVREAYAPEVVRKGYNSDGTALVYEWVWDLRDSKGSSVSSGIYFHLVRAEKGGDFAEMRGKAVILK